MINNILNKVHCELHHYNDILNINSEVSEDGHHCTLSVMNIYYDFFKVSSLPKKARNDALICVQ